VSTHSSDKRGHRTAERLRAGAHSAARFPRGERRGARAGADRPARRVTFGASESQLKEADKGVAMFRGKPLEEGVHSLS
jgi:hypothetical protein